MTDVRHGRFRIAQITCFDCEVARGRAVEAYFVKLSAMLHKHGSGKWNYDIFAISSRLPRREV